MSVLTPQNVEVRFGAADTKGSQKLSIPGTLEVAQNVVMTETGRYDRREGTAALTTQAGVRNIHDHGNELLLGTPDVLYSRFANTNNNRGNLTSFDTRTETVNNTPFSQAGHDMTVVSLASRQWSVWVDGRGGIRYSVRDISTGAYIVSEGIITTGDMTAPRVFALSTDVLITYLDANNSGTTTLYGCKIAAFTPASVGAEITIDSEYLAGAGFPLNGYDGVALSSSEVLLAYTCAFGGSSTDERIRMKLWNVGTMTGTTTLSESADSGATGSGGVAIIHSSGSYHVVHSSGGAFYKIRLLIAASDLSSFTTTATIKDFGGTTTLKHVTGFLDGSSRDWIFAQAEVASGDLTRSVIHAYSRTAAGVVTERYTKYGFQLASSPFVSGASVYVCVVTPLPGDLTTTASWFVMDTLTGTLVGRALSRRASATQLGTPTLPVPQVTSSGFVVAAAYQVSTSQVGATLVHIAPSVRQRWLECQGTTVIPGSWPRIYDGLGVTELGFEGPPFIVGYLQSGSAGLADGTYYYRLTWFWVDGTGFEHESEPSPAAPFTVTGGPANYTLTVETLTATLKQAPSQSALLRVWRTTGNPSAASGAAFFLAGTVANSGGVTISFVDAMADATLVTKQRLYTLGDTVLANTPSSPAAAMATWGGRLWGWDGDFLIYSKLLEDSRGVSHSDVNFMPVLDSYGDGVALADAGSRLLAFKRTAIYAVTGQGPDNLGVGEFPPIDRLELPLGARSQHSIVSTELGVLFQDHLTGQIWLIGDNGAEYIGAPVEALSSALTIVDAVQVGRQVRFYSSSGTTLVFDLHHKIWTWWTGQAAVGAGAINGLAHYVTSTGAVWHDDPIAWTEAGAAYQAVLETGWLSFAGLAGHQRTYRVHALGENLGAHTVSFKPSYRFGTGTETKALASSAILAGHGYRVEFRPSLTYQRSTAIKVRIEDNSPSTAGWGLEALVLEVGIDRKAARLPTAHRAT
jgi:hypothetical protein